MTKTRIAAALAAAACLAATAFDTAHAQSFDGDDVEGFLAVMKDLEGIGEKYEDRDDADILAIRQRMETDFSDFGALIDDDGDFRIFRLTTEAMARAGDIEPVRDYRQAVTANGFGGLSDFGAKADAIMMAWMATQMDADDMAGMQDLDPSVMAMMPPAMRAQMEGVMKLGEALADVPAEDIAMLKPYKKKLKKAFK